MDPERFDLRGELEVGRDVCIDINVIIEGKVKIGNNCIIEAGCIIRNAELGDDVRIKAYSVIDEVKIGDQSEVGPFDRLRPGTVLETGARVGNFVEVKNTTLGTQSKGII